MSSKQRKELEEPERQQVILPDNGKLRKRKHPDFNYFNPKEYLKFQESIEVEVKSGTSKNNNKLQLKKSSKKSKHLCKKRNNHFKSSTVKLDKVSQNLKKIKSKLKPKVKRKFNHITLKRNKDNRTIERSICGKCGTEFKTPVELLNHDCDRILHYMKSCVVKLYNLPLFVMVNETREEVSPKSHASLLSGNENNSNVRCPNCCSEYKTLDEHSDDLCKKVLDNMKSCVVKLDKLLGFDVNNTGKFTLFECLQCKRVFIDESLMEHHTSFKTTEICTKNIKAIELVVNSYSKNTTDTNDEVTINNNGHAQYSQPSTSGIFYNSNSSITQISSDMLNAVGSNKEHSNSVGNYIQARENVNNFSESNGKNVKIQENLPSNALYQKAATNSVNINNNVSNSSHSQNNVDGASTEQSYLSSGASQSKSTHCWFF